MKHLDTPLRRPYGVYVCNISGVVISEGGRVTFERGEQCSTGPSSPRGVPAELIKIEWCSTAEGQAPSGCGRCYWLCQPVFSHERRRILSNPGSILGGSSGIRETCVYTCVGALLSRHEFPVLADYSVMGSGDLPVLLSDMLESGLVTWRAGTQACQTLGPAGMLQMRPR